MTKPLAPYATAPAGTRRAPSRDGDWALSVAERAFTALVAGRKPVSVDGAAIGHGLPARMIGLGELRSILLHPSVGHPARDAAWRYLVAGARTGRPEWVLGAVGMAMPGLRWHASRWCTESNGADVQAELIVGFLAALKVVDVDGSRICAALLNGARNAARQFVTANEAAYSGEGFGAPGSAMPPVPWGHPDLVLNRAVAAGVITARQAHVIGATRLEEVTLAEYARMVGRDYEAVKRCRARGEANLAAAIGDGSLADPHIETIIDATLTTAYDRDAVA